MRNQPDPPPHPPTLGETTSTSSRRRTCGPSGTSAWSSTDLFRPSPQPSQTPRTFPSKSRCKQGWSKHPLEPLNEDLSILFNYILSFCSFVLHSFSELTTTATTKLFLPCDLIFRHNLFLPCDLILKNENSHNNNSQNNNKEKYDMPIIM